jgi:hypothetical protein
MWVVVGSGGKRYIGRVVENLVEGTQRLMLHDAFELVVLNLPVGTPEGLAIQHIATCQPIDGCKGPTMMEVVYDSIHWFSGMEVSDRKRHEKIVEEGVAQMREMRARESGLVMPSGAQKGGLVIPGVRS